MEIKSLLSMTFTTLPPLSPHLSLQREQSQVILTSLRNRKAESELQDLNPSKKIRIVHLFY